ncbi:MAG TPA: hypothetical protein VM582_04000 [Candidatus Thermoplasmatota archaeon]|nr:hypothetical protein [Candidatus Thermoplasmatota archaeon]
MRSSAVLIAIVLLLSAATPLIHAQTPGSGQGPGTGGGPGAGGMPRGGERERALAAQETQDWANLSTAARERGLARAEAARLFGGLDVDEAGAVTSPFVGFQLDAGSLRDYAIVTPNGTVPYFANVSVEGFGAAAEPHVSGSVLRLFAEEAFFAAHANPLGLLSYRVRNVALNMTFSLAEGVVATSDDERSLTLSTPEGAHGHIVLTSNAQYEIPEGNDRVVVALGPHARLLFMHHPQQTAFTATLHALRDAAAADRVGALISVVADEEGPVQDRAFLSGVTARATQAREGRAEILVSSENSAPRAVVVNLDPALFPDANVSVTLDGQPVPMATSAAEALNSSQALAHVQATPGGLHAIIAVPSFSERAIVIAAPATTQPTPTVTPSTSPTPHADPTPTSVASPTPQQRDDTPGAAPLAVAGLAALVALLRRRRA